MTFDIQAQEEDSPEGTPSPDESPFVDPPLEEIEKGLNPFEKETRSDDAQ